jgi:hypothetical protein
MPVNARSRLGLGVLLLLVTVAVALAQEREKMPAGYKGVHWTIAPKPATKDGKSFALNVYEFRFDKQALYGSGGCWTTEKSMWGSILRCPMTLPATIPGGIVQLTFRCIPDDPKGPCGHTIECPGGNACSEAKHLFPTTPDNLPVSKPRSLDWWGWTDDGNHATLIFNAYVQ